MTAVRLDGVYSISEEVVAREIEGELIIVPLAAGVGGSDDELFTLNDTGKEIWRRLDGRASLEELAASLAREYDAPPGEIEKDLLGLAAELLGRRMIVEAKR